MPVEVILPKVDMDMATGQISRWYVEEGAAVKKGDAALRDRDRQGGDGSRGAGERAAARRIAVPGRPSTSARRWPGSMPKAKRSGRSRPGRPRLSPSRAVDAPAAEPPSVNGAGRRRREGIRATPIARRLARDSRDRARLGRRYRPARPHPARGRREALKRRPRRPPRPRLEPAAWSEEAGDLFVSTRKGTGTPVLLMHGFAGDFDRLAAARARAAEATCR